MYKLTTILSLITLFNVSFAANDVEVLFSPDSLEFKNTTKQLLSSDYSKFVELCLGFSTEKPSNWDGFYRYKNFANIPRSIVTLHFPFSLKSIATQVFPIEDSSNINQQFSQISSALLSRFDDAFTEMVELSKQKNVALPLSEQINLLNNYLVQLKELKAKNAMPTRLSLWFEFVSISKLDNEFSSKIEEKIENTVNRIRKLFDDKVIIVSLFDEDLKSINRNPRQTDSKATDVVIHSLNNLAYEYSIYFHTAFTTIGFTTIVLLLTVFIVSVAMWNIDPGRDSIIYRLTSQKIKKDQ